MYEQYFTSSDVTITISSMDHKRQVEIDTAVGIGYNQNISAIPIYGLGNNQPQVFSMGNSIVSGTLELSFKSTKYLQKVLNYVTGVSNEITKRLKEISEKDQSKLTKEDIQFYLANKDKIFRTTVLSDNASIAEYVVPVNIILRYNNSNSFKTDNDKFLTIVGTRFVSSSQGISSSMESLVTDQIRFIAKTLEHK